MMMKAIIRHGGSVDPDGGKEAAFGFGLALALSKLGGEFYLYYLYYL